MQQSLEQCQRTSFTLSDAINEVSFFLAATRALLVCKCIACNATKSICWDGCWCCCCCDESDALTGRLCRSWLFKDNKVELSCWTSVWMVSRLLIVSDTEWWSAMVRIWARSCRIAVARKTRCSQSIPNTSSVIKSPISKSMAPVIPRLRNISPYTAKSSESCKPATHFSTSCGFQIVTSSVSSPVLKIRRKWWKEAKFQSNSRNRHTNSWSLICAHLSLDARVLAWWKSLCVTKLLTCAKMKWKTGTFTVVSLKRTCSTVAVRRSYEPNVPSSTLGWSTFWTRLAPLAGLPLPVKTFFLFDDQYHDGIKVLHEIQDLGTIARRMVIHFSSTLIRRHHQHDLHQSVVSVLFRTIHDTSYRPGCVSSLLDVINHENRRSGDLGRGFETETTNFDG